MATAKSTKITIQTAINAGIEKVWEFYTNPKHIIHWNLASEDWHSPRAENDLRNGSRFSWRSMLNQLQALMNCVLRLASMQKWEKFIKR